MTKKMNSQTRRNNRGQNPIVTPFSAPGATEKGIHINTSHISTPQCRPTIPTRRRGFNPDGSINLDLDSRIELDLRNDQKENGF